MNKTCFLTLGGLLSLAACLSGALSVSPFITDHMVIQRDAPIVIAGKSDPGAGVTAQLQSLQRSLSASGQASPEGTFELVLDALPAGGPYRLIVSNGPDTVTIKDILLGDIWICSGQSNMQWPLRDTNDAGETISRSYENGIRLFSVPRLTSKDPQDTVRGGPWHHAAPATTANFSAVGYYFGRELHHRTGVPIGLVNSSWGGTPVEVWISPHAIEYKKEAPILPASPEFDSTYARNLVARINDLLGELKQKDPKRKLSLMVRGGGTPRTATICYNAMVNPLTKFPVKGVIWYQGEANASEAEAYRELFPLFIEDWRNAWDQPDLPVYFVQLANYRERVEVPQESDWAELREAQKMTLELPHTGMAVIMDIGEANDIHPRNKHDVGLRLARQALAKNYGLKDLVTDGPVLKDVKMNGAEVKLRFSSIAEGLELREPVQGAFAIASEEGPYHFADAQLDGDTVILSTPEVAEPRYVRYGWADNPPAPLYNSEGLPASPFRTDDRPISSAQQVRKASQPSHYLEAKSRQAFLGSPDWQQAGQLRYAFTGETDDAKAAGAFDNDPLTRWSIDEMGSMLLVDLGAKRPCPEILLSFFNGDSRQQVLRVETSVDGKQWQEQFFGLSSGESEEMEAFPGSKKPVRYVLLSFFGNTANLWNSVLDVSFPQP